jgi:transcriptional regulator with XRE-family HTH domain
MRAGELIRERRLKHGLSQRRLAHRAGTSQSAIARIERGDEDISWKRLESLLLALGEEPVLDSKRVWSRYDAWDMEEERKRPPELRLAGGLALNKFSSKLARAGRAARRVA